MTFRKLRRMETILNARDVAEIERLYDSEVAFTDFAVGRLLERLRADGRFDDAVIVVTGDHGEEFLDHGALGHTRTLYEELIRVPLLIKYPRRAPERSDEPVALIDLYPTLLDVLGLDLDPSLRGRSLLQGGGEEAARPLFAETSREADLRAVVRGHEKLILDLEHGTAAMYDLASDPKEQEDLSSARPEQVAELRGLIETWMERNPPLGSTTERELSNEELEKLRALGYQ